MNNQPPPQKPGERCCWCPTRPGRSEVAWHVYGIDDAICEECNGTGFVPLGALGLPSRSPIDDDDIDEGTSS